MRGGASEREENFSGTRFKERGGGERRTSQRGEGGGLININLEGGEKNEKFI